MLEHLPGDISEVIDWPWDRFAGFYATLESTDLTQDNVEQWLLAWTRVSEILGELSSRLRVATTVDTTDETADTRYKRYLDEISSPREEAEQRLMDKFLSSGLEVPGFERARKCMESDKEIFRQENLPLQIQEQKIGLEYDRVIGGQTIQWEGKECTVPQMATEFQSPDRERREKAWRAVAERQLEDRDTISEIWGRFLENRLEQATNAGFDDYRSYRWRQYHRFDYTPDDCQQFRDAIAEVAVPAASRILERRKQALGYDALRPWDMDVDPAGRDPLRPFEDAQELISVSQQIFHKVDPELGAFFDTMANEGLLDLDNRKGKAPGGYCSFFPKVRQPFIFMNAVGVHDDVQTLLHEAGHAFHAFESAALPYIDQIHAPIEFCEVASMAMELIAGPYLEGESSFYDRTNAARARLQHLERNIRFWPYMAVVDGFQHWVYENPDAARDPRALDAKWLELSRVFQPDVSWDGLQDVRESAWQRKLHIHRIPFYYVEYGLAQVGAPQAGRASMKHPAKALTDYRASLRLGGTVSIPELFAAAGGRFAFDADTLGELVQATENAIDELAEVA